ncbi:MAG: hypothetical protein K9L59_16770 [Desulfobacterales bacterium]|nr:hypothetical protein [Desulfobacterales bacterium]
MTDTSYPGSTPLDRAGLEKRVTLFLSQPTVDAALRELDHHLPPAAAVYLVGGAIRNLAIDAIHGYRPEIRDLDLFINRVGKDTVLSERFPADRFETTDLGGIRWRPEGCGYDMDLCLMKDFVVLVKLRLSPTLDHLLETLDFTMNTLVYDLKRKHLYERNALSDIRRRLLEFNTRTFYTRLATCYRALLLRHKTGFIFSEDVFRFLRSEVDIDTLIEARRLFRGRQGKAVAEALLEYYDRVCTSHDYDDYLRRHRKS